MIEIIPNWHPLLVHFTVGLLSTSVLFYLGSAVLSQTRSWKQQWLNMANWSLWSGCLFAIATAIAGWLAYNSVAHDSASHAAMTLHRNWALPTASIFLLLGLWAILIARTDRQPGFLFLTFSLIAAGLLMVTGWLGSEAVYRYGLGVKSLPVVTEGADGHNHSHGAEHDESVMDKGGHRQGATGGEQPLTGGAHQHSHENKEIRPEKGQLLNQDGHQHKHESQLLLTEQPIRQDGHQHGHEHEHKNTLSKIEQANEVTEHTHKKMTDDNTGLTVQLPTAKPHAHDINSLESIATPLGQDNASEEIPISPSELDSLYPTERQNNETVPQVTHSHDHNYEH